MRHSRELRLFLLVWRLEDSLELTSGLTLEGDKWGDLSVKTRYGWECACNPRLSLWPVRVELVEEFPYGFFSRMN